METASQSQASPREALVDQASRWVQTQDAYRADFGPDPLRNRQARLPGQPDAGRFNIREPMSTAKVVGVIGGLFGGAGYRAGPCPRIREERDKYLGDISKQGRARLEEELRREQAYCRP